MSKRKASLFFVYFQIDWNPATNNPRILPYVTSASRYDQEWNQESNPIWTGGATPSHLKNTIKTEKILTPCSDFRGLLAVLLPKPTLTTNDRDLDGTYSMDKWGQIIGCMGDQRQVWFSLLSFHFFWRIEPMPVVVAIGMDWSWVVFWRKFM